MDKRRIGVRAIIFKDGKLLASTFQTESGESKHWAVPGGGLDPRESLTDGLKREIIEETGVTPMIGKLLFVQQFKSDRTDRHEELEFFFHVTNPEDFGDISLTETTHGATELVRCEFITPANIPVRPAFLRTIDIASYIEQDLPVYLYNEL
jgi:ADP-ribose pyrophosphatase YjhB (NUDIX family)